MRWHYDTLAEFNRQWYDGLLTTSNLLDEELFISEYKDENGIPTIVEKFFFVLKSGKIKYLLDSGLIDKLPIIAKHIEKVSYKGKGYRLITNAKSVKFKPERAMSFRELVDSFADYQHSEPEELFKLKLIVLVSWLNRINVRIATEPAFGKDSVVNVLSYLMGNIGKVNNPTIAKLEYLLYNKVLMINEVSGIKSEDRQYVEQFLLSAGDFSNTYEKRSRASSGSSEKYDISKLSLILAYNTLNNYKNQDKYFDYMFQNNDAVVSRIMPFKFDGILTEHFDIPFDAKQEVEQSKEYFEDFIRTMMYYREHLYDEMKHYKLKKGLKQAIDSIPHQRWKQTFNRLMLYVDLYSEGETEFNRLVAGLYNSHLSYQRMLVGGNTTLNTPFNIDVEEVHMDNDWKERAYNKLKEMYHEQGHQVDMYEFMKEADITEEDVQQLVKDQMIVEARGKLVPL